MITLHDWQIRHKISYAAMVDLRQVFGLVQDSKPTSDFTSEAGVQSAIRLEAAQKGVLMFRNNVGAYEDNTGRWIRYGLANESAQMNGKIKSGDLIGVRPVLITNDHVGSLIGQFVSREIKRPDWNYLGTPAERAQLRWIEVISAAGGDACFTNSVGSL